MRVSIVINNFEYGRFLGQCIDSALSQGWEQTEVVVVDDGSTDESRSIIERYGDTIVAVFKENGGQTSTMNAGFAASSGDIVIFLDADDVLVTDAASQIVAAFTSHEHAARVQWPMRVVDSEGMPTGELSPKPKLMKSGDLANHVLRYRTHVWPATSGSAYARCALDELMPIPSDFNLGNDLYLAETTPFIGDVITIDTPLSDYRHHGSNTWTGARPDGRYMRTKIDWTMKSHEHVKRIAKAHGFDPPESALEALDVAFICQRLASLRLDTSNHPIKSDSRIALTLRGLKAAVLHPHHDTIHKTKRVAWIVGVGLGPRYSAMRLIDRFYG